MIVKLKSSSFKNSKVLDLKSNKSYGVIQNRHNLMYSIKGESGEIKLYPSNVFEIVEK